MFSESDVSRKPDQIVVNMNESVKAINYYKKEIPVKQTFTNLWEVLNTLNKSQNYSECSKHNCEQIQ